jgi:membrane protease YdiL (CAAX protease family)
MISKKMLFITLWSIGMVGVFSTLWTNLPIPEKDLPLPLIVIKLVNLVFPTFLLSIGVAIGLNLAHKVGLSAPFSEAIATGSSQKILVLKPQIVPGLIGGLVGGVVISLWFRLWESSLPSDFLTKGEELSKSTRLLTRILYGGITEELMIRWGLMTLIVFLAWRIFQQAQGVPHPTCFIGAIIISSLAFGLGHLPLAFALTTQVTTSLVLYIVIGNSLFGLIAGYLYWQKGLEAAIIAHMLTHLVVGAIDLLKR